tara:strand:- start:12092 stop:12700 length:609 start_codon:yes stop_codon:yes gene_type:complete
MEHQNHTVLDILPTLVPAILRRVQLYHTLFELPLIAEQWEETLHRAFGDVGWTTTWKPNRSHAVGEDMRLPSIENSRLSCKSGQFVKDRSLGQCVKFNGGRSTQFETLEDKLTHFSQPHDDFYFLLAKKKNFDRQYKLIVFASPVCRVNQLNWTEASSGKSWNGTGDFKALIGKSMSAQLWTTLPLNMVGYSFDIDARGENP